MDEDILELVETLKRMGCDPLEILPWESFLVRREDGSSYLFNVMTGWRKEVVKTKANDDICSKQSD